MNENNRQDWILPPLTESLQKLVAEVYTRSKGGFEEQNQGEHQEVKGLKFISNKLVKLFEKNRKMKYSSISKILIDNFSSESNDSRNIKRRVYDAINVMVAAGLFIKNGDILQKHQSSSFRDKVQNLKIQIGKEHKQLQSKVNNKKLLLNRLSKRKLKLKELIQRNKKNDYKSQPIAQVISDPIIVNLKDGTRNVKINSENNQVCFGMDIMNKMNQIKTKTATKTQIFKDGEYLQYL